MNAHFPCGLLAALLLAPALASAGTITIYNDDATAVPVIVQATCVVRGKLVRDKPDLLTKGDKSHAIALPGNKVVTIYDARVANRVLFQTVIADSADDLQFTIAPDTTAPKLKLVPRRPAMRP